LNVRQVAAHGPRSRRSDRPAGEDIPDGGFEIVHRRSFPFLTEIDKAVVDASAINETARAIEDGGLRSQSGFGAANELVAGIQERRAGEFVFGAVAVGSGAACESRSPAVRASPTSPISSQG